MGKKRNVYVENTVFNGTILSILGLIFGGPGVGVVAALGTAIFARKHRVDADEMEYLRKHSHVKSPTFEELKQEKAEQEKAAVEIYKIMENAPKIKTRYDYMHGMSSEEVYVHLGGPSVCKCIQRNHRGSLHYMKEFFNEVDRKDCYMYGNPRDFLDRLREDISIYGKDKIIMYRLEGFGNEGRWMYSVNNGREFIACY